jgi:hypothetical protein
MAIAMTGMIRSPGPNVANELLNEEGINLLNLGAGQG